MKFSLEKEFDYDPMDPLKRLLITDSSFMPAINLQYWFVCCFLSMRAQAEARIRTGPFGKSPIGFSNIPSAEIAWLSTL